MECSSCVKGRVGEAGRGTETSETRVHSSSAAPVVLAVSYVVTISGPPRCTVRGSA